MAEFKSHDQWVREMAELVASEKETAIRSTMDLISVAKVIATLFHKLNNSERKLESLQDGVQRFLNGDYPCPSAYRHDPDARGKCPHERYYWDECTECNDEYLEGILNASRGVENEQTVL